MSIITGDNILKWADYFHCLKYIVLIVLAQESGGMAQTYKSTKTGA